MVESLRPEARRMNRELLHVLWILSPLSLAIAVSAPEVVGGPQPARWDPRA
jgi:hypothetical protein